MAHYSFASLPAAGKRAKAIARYLDVWEAGGLTLDDEGIELRDIKAVQDAAMRSLADMAREPVNSEASVGHDMAIEVRDTDGTVLQVKLTLVIERPIIANGQGRAEVNMRGGSSAPNSNISRPAPFSDLSQPCHDRHFDEQRKCSLSSHYSSS